MTQNIYEWRWLWRGARQIVSIPALVLMSAFIGYGGIVRDAGLTLGQAAFSVPAIWALPSNLILVAGISSGASMLAIIISVTLASVRMLPMTMALMPEIRTEGTRRWHLYGAACLVAVTAWVHALQAVEAIPRKGRLPYFLGVAAVLVTGSTLVTVATYVLAAQFPPLVAAALYFLTPLYFAISMWKTARHNAEHLAVILGFALGAVLVLTLAGGHLLIAGFVGGTIAFLYGRWRDGKSA